MAWKFPPENRARLESAERLELLPVDRLLTLARVRRGERVLDVGCGTGVMTLPLARAVGGAGRVHAIDLHDEMLEEARRRAAESGLSNIEFALSEESVFPIADGAVDLVFASQILHELHDPPAFLAENRRVLAPGGRLAVFDWEKIETGIGPPLDHRIDSAEARSWLETAGFDVIEAASVSWANYAFLARP